MLNRIMHLVGLIHEIIQGCTDVNRTYYVKLVVNIRRADDSTHILDCYKRLYKPN